MLPFVRTDPVRVLSGTPHLLVGRQDRFFSPFSNNEAIADSEENLFHNKQLKVHSWADTKLIHFGDGYTHGEDSDNSQDLSVKSRGGSGEGVGI